MLSVVNTHLTMMMTNSVVEINKETHIFAGVSVKVWIVTILFVIIIDILNVSFPVGILKAITLILLKLF